MKVDGSKGGKAIGLQSGVIFEKKNVFFLHFRSLKVVYDLGHEVKKVQFEFLRSCVPLASRSNARS